MINVALTLRVDENRERRDAVDQNWYGVFSQAGLRPILLPNSLDAIGGDVASLIRDLSIEGVILSGGNDLPQAPSPENMAPERDAVEAALIDTCAALDIPLLGVCRGLQMLNLHYGGKVSTVEGHIATRHPIDVLPSCTVKLASRRETNSYHGFGLQPDDLSPEFEALAKSPDGSIEAIAHKNYRQWGIMWHPEREPFDAQDVALIRDLFLTNSSEHS